MVDHAAENKGRLEFMVLKNPYEGIGVHAVFYSGEKKPHPWWDEFQRHLTDALNTYDRLQKKSVH